MPKLLKDTVKAWINTMPGADHTLIVTGKIETPTSGWSAKITSAKPQEGDSSVIVVEVEVISPDGEAVQVISRCDFRYEESPPKHQYVEATVKHGGQECTVPVKVTS